MAGTKADLFERAPIPRAVLSLAVPTILSQLITIFYNLADTFFIGQLGDPAKVAAVVVSMPAFIMLTGIANLFGLGGTSLISRSLGEGNVEKAQNTASFCITSGLVVGLIYGLLFSVFRGALLPFLGATEETFAHAYQYIFWTTTLGGIPTVMNSLLAHLVRSEGASRQSGFGIALGGCLNIALDPLFMFVFKMGLVGAAVATLVSNCVAVAYFVIFLYRHRRTTIIKCKPTPACLRDGIPREVVLVGLPGFVMTVMSTVSNVTLTRLISGYSTAAVAGMGIAKKIDTMAFCIAQGLTQGVLPLLGYNYAARNINRLKQAIRFTLIVGIASSLAIFALLYTLATPITRLFINNPETVECGSRFLHIICFVCLTTCANFFMITLFQAAGKKVQPLVLSILRKGVIDLPLMILFNRLSGLYGIAWAIPMADWICFAVSILLFIPFMREVNGLMGQKQPRAASGI